MAAVSRFRPTRIGFYGALLSGPVDVGTMLDAKDSDYRGRVVDLVDDAICTASR
jgi:hypothetical protein